MMSLVAVHKGHKGPVSTMILGLLAKAVEVFRVGSQIGWPFLDPAAELLYQIECVDDRLAAALQALLQSLSEDGGLRKPLLAANGIELRRQIVRQLAGDYCHTSLVIPDAAFAKRDSRSPCALAETKPAG